MIIIIIILASGINHSHVRARSGQGAGGEGRGNGGHQIAGVLDIPKSQRASHVSGLCIHMSTVSPASIKEGLLSIRPAPTASQHTYLTDCDQWRLFTWTTCQKAAKYELAANSKGSRLSSWKDCLSGHPSLNSNEWLWQAVLASAHWDLQ